MSCYLQDPTSEPLVPSCNVAMKQRVCKIAAVYTPRSKPEPYRGRPQPVEASIQPYGRWELGSLMRVGGCAVSYGSRTHGEEDDRNHGRHHVRYKNPCGGSTGLSHSFETFISLRGTECSYDTQVENKLLGTHSPNPFVNPQHLHSRRFRSVPQTSGHTTVAAQR